MFKGWNNKVSEDFVIHQFHSCFFEEQQPKETSFLCGESQNSQLKYCGRGNSIIGKNKDQSFNLAIAHWRVRSLNLLFFTDLQSLLRKAGISFWYIYQFS